MSEPLKVGVLAAVVGVVASGAVADAATVRAVSGPVTIRAHASEPFAPEVGAALPPAHEVHVGRHGLADIDLDRGTVRILSDSKVAGAGGRLRVLDGSVVIAAASGVTIDVATPLGSVQISGTARLDVAADVGAETVSVRAGTARFANANGAVVVDEGLGSVSTIDLPPARPQKVPSAPDWDVTGHLTMIADSAVHARWLPRSDVVAVEVVVTPYHEPDDLLLRWRSSRDSAPIPTLPPGLYRVALSAVDDRGLVSPSGAGMALVVLPAPRRPDGVVLGTRGSRVLAPGPGTLVQPAPEGMKVSFGGGGAVTLERPGRHSVPYTLTNGRPDHVFEGTMNVEVEVPRIDVPRPSVAVTNGVSTAQVRFRITGGSDSPIVGMRFLVHKIQAPAEVIVAVGSDGIHDSEGRLEQCACEAEADTIEVDEIGGGYYGFHVSRLAESDAFEMVEVMSPQSGLRYAFPVPVGSPSDEQPAEIATPRAEPPPDYPSGAYVSVRMGGQTATEDGIDFWLGAEIGARIGVTETLFIDVGAQVAGVERSLRHSNNALYRVGVYPLQGRASFVAAFDEWRPYIGGAMGVRIIQLPAETGADGGTEVQPAWTVFAGLGISLGPGELLAELGYGTAEIDSADLEGTLGGLNVVVGYRLMPDFD